MGSMEGAGPSTVSAIEGFCGTAAGALAGFG
jgi:hypothetical protein